MSGDSRMKKVRELTDELNNVVREIEICKNNDDIITLVFRAAVILEKLKKLIKEKSGSI